MPLFLGCSFFCSKKFIFDDNKFIFVIDFRKIDGYNYIK